MMMSATRTGIETDCASVARRLEVTIPGGSEALKAFAAELDQSWMDVTTREIWRRQPEPDVPSCECWVGGILFAWPICPSADVVLIADFLSRRLHGDDWQVVVVRSSVCLES